MRNQQNVVLKSQAQQLATKPESQVVKKCPCLGKKPKRPIVREILSCVKSLVDFFKKNSKGQLIRTEKNFTEYEEIAPNGTIKKWRQCSEVEWKIKGET